MRNKKNVFKAQIIALAALALSVFIMPIFSEIWMQSGNNWIMVANGLCFWVSLLSLIVISAYFCVLRKKSEFTKQKIAGYNKWGLIHFFQNTEAKIADIIMLLSLICFLIQKTFFLLAVLIFSSGMHCLLNGAGYLYVKHNVDEKGNLSRGTQEEK